MKRKKRIKLEEVVVEALRLLPRGVDVPSFTNWVTETLEQNKTLPRVRNKYEKDFIPSKGLEGIQTSTTPDATSDR